MKVEVKVISSEYPLGTVDGVSWTVYPNDRSY